MASSNKPQDWSDRRNAPRVPVRLPAKMLGDYFSCGGTLLNISRTGAMMDTSYPPAPGRDVTLLCDKVETAARIMWVRDRKLGLAFDRELGDRDISELAEAAC